MTSRVPARRARSDASPTDDAAVPIGAGAAVEVEDGPLRVSAGDLDVDHGDPAEAPGRCRDVGRNRDRRHHLLEDDPLLGHVAAEIERRVSQQLVKSVALLLAHGCPFRLSRSGLRLAEQKFGPVLRGECDRLGDERARGGIVERGWRLGSVRDRHADLLEELLLACGEQRHSSRAGRSETFRKTCGALAGTLIVSPAVATALTPRNVTSISPSRTVNISSKSWR